MVSERPSAVRARILRDHEALRDRLDELSVVTRVLRDGDAATLERAVAMAAELLQVLSLHLEAEDAVLAPALREVDAWGPIRAERLLQHHVEQREQLAVIASRSQAERSPAALAAVLAALIEDLRADMAHEERDVLSADLLRDDVITSGEDG